MSDTIRFTIDGPDLRDGDDTIGTLGYSSVNRESWVVGFICRNSTGTVPVGLFVTPEQARMFAAELVKLADHVEFRNTMKTHTTLKGMEF